MYGKVHGVQKITVHIAEDVKRALTRVAAARGVSEAELIREALPGADRRGDAAQTAPAFVQEWKPGAG